MSDEFEEFLRREARGLHEPPARVPRDEMWTAIAARRRELAEQRRRRPALVLRWSVAAAAVLAVGVGIGRLTVGGGGEPVVAGGDRAAAAQSAAGYRYAAAEYFDHAEVLITLFLVDARQGRTYPDAADRARDLLSTNRLLQDSPASDDPELKALLDDLELVLAQIAQLAAQRGSGERDLIVRGLRDNGTLMRLQSASPTRPPALYQRGEL